MKAITLEDIDVYPSKVICIGRNYVDHIKELNNEVPAEPVIFIKPNSAIANELSFNHSDAIHFEGEICFLVRKNKLYAVGFGLDLTKREIQSNLKAKGLPWERAKSFDKSAVFSKFVRFRGNVSELSLELHINGQLVQKAEVALMLNKPDEILKEMNSFLTIEDDDVIMTGTPKGVGAIHIGDTFTGQILVKERLLVKDSWIVQP